MTGAPLRILVVDDDDLSREALVDGVELLGYPCDSACDGQDAWEKLQHTHADVIVSDWQMPRMDGLELCRRTRAGVSGGGYRYFIFLTSYSDKDHFVRGLEAGADDFQAKPVDIDELRARLVSAGRVVELYRQLAEKNAALLRDSEASFRAARVDALTTISNRRSLDEDLKTLWSRTRRYGHRYTLALGDVDRFKAYNDRFGHVAGDDVLRVVAQTIRDQLREGDGVYRYGGEEFVILLPEQSITEAVSATERIRRAVETRAIPCGPPGAVVTISFGVAEVNLDVDASAEDWLRRADTALYRAKANGRNRVELAQLPATTPSPPPPPSSSSIIGAFRGS